jgi:hypothetical protein
LKIPSEQGSTLALLIKTWNVIREADSRPTLSDTQASLLPQNEQLHSFFSNIFTSPFTWDAAHFPTVLKRQHVLEEAVTIYRSSH